MSGSKVVTVTLLDLLIPLAAPALPYLTYYTGKAAFSAGKGIVKGANTTIDLAAKGIERYCEYQRHQEDLRKAKLEQARQETCNQLSQNINLASSICQQVCSQSFMKDSATLDIVKRIENISDKFSSNLDLETAVGLNLELEKNVSALKSRITLAQAGIRQREALQVQMDQLRQTIQTQRDIPAAPELAALENYIKRVNAATIDSLSPIKSEYSVWATSLLNKIKTVHTDAKVKNVVYSLWSAMPVNQKLAQQYDPEGFAEVKRIGTFLLSPNTPPTAKEAELVRFQNVFTKHKAAVEQKMQLIAKQEAEIAKLRNKFEPELDAMPKRLALIDKEVVNRWEGVRLSNLTRQLADVKTNFSRGVFQTMESDVAIWNETFDSMLAEAGKKQQDEEFRQYLVEALKLELPKLGFDIQSLSNPSGATSNMVIKVVPQVQKTGARQRITITVPQESDKPINYKFDGYDIKHKSVEGRPVIENDAGKQTVNDIASVLKEYGISMSQPDWSGNPDKIQKNADSLPDDNNPAQNQDLSHVATQYRSLEL